MAMMITSGNTVGFMLKDFYAFYEFQTKFNTIETISDLSKLFSQKTLIERLSLIFFFFFSFFFYFKCMNKYGIYQY